MFKKLGYDDMEISIMTVEELQFILDNNVRRDELPSRKSKDLEHRCVMQYVREDR